MPYPPQPTRAQQITATSSTLTDSLICRSMENVSCSENILEINYILETSAWRQPSAGITKAVEYIQNYGIPEGKDCRIIVLDNNIPQFSLYYLHNSLRVPQNFKRIRQQ